MPQISSQILRKATDKSVILGRNTLCEILIDQKCISPTFIIDMPIIFKIFLLNR